MKRGFVGHRNEGSTLLKNKAERSLFFVQRGQNEQKKEKNMKNRKNHINQI